MTEPGLGKILWHSNHPASGTGYGQQTGLFTPRIRDLGYHVGISSFYGIEGHVSSWEGMPVYPTDITRYGKAWLKWYVKHFAAGEPLDDVLVMTLMDCWTWIDLGRGGLADWKDLRLASWVPIDHDPLPPGVAQALAHYDSRPIAMSKFGLEKLIEGGFDNALYVPHGIDTEIYKPRPEDRATFREAATKMGIPADAFVVGMVANNVGNSPPRKAFPQIFQAFSVFHEQHPDSFLYLHTEERGIFEGGLNLKELALAFGIPDNAYGFVEQSAYLMGVIPARTMAATYNYIDVLLNPSYGEGFGVPIIEAQACGTPVIVTDWTSMPELRGAGWLVDGDSWWDPHHGAFFKNPSVLSILEALEAAYEARGDQAVSAKAREFALDYDADRITDTYWKPVLAQIQEEHEAMRAQPAVAFKPNRAMRRAVAKKPAMPTYGQRG